ncbi:hypothetical protein BGW80DRAFT_1311509 [Lactifluus volemus]|nr:hypothetical protein BGW80DRAFT_1311509 [Lactifluus volemus]
MTASFTRNLPCVSMLSRFRTACFQPHPDRRPGRPRLVSSFQSALWSPLITVGKAKNLWFKSTPRCPAPVVTAPEDFDIPHIFVTEETKSPPSAAANVSRSTGVHAPMYPLSSTHASMTLEDSDRLETAADDDQYEGILEESDDVWEPGDSEYHAMLVTEEEVDDTLSDLETESEGASRNQKEVGDDDDISLSEKSWRHIVVMDQVTFVPQGQVALGRCQALLLSSFARRRQYQLWEHPHRSMMRAGPARLTLLTPALMHESASYEDALFSELEKSVCAS